MRRTLPILLVGLALAGVAAIAAAAPDTSTPMPKVQARMKAVVDKASTELFNIAVMADPANGPDQKLPDAAGWATAKADAGKLKAAADWLQDRRVGKTREAKWTAAATSMGALSAAAEKAAARRDAAGLAKAANDLSDTCTACHSVYKKQS